MNKNSGSSAYMFSSGFVLALALMNMYEHYYILGLILLVIALIEFKVAFKKVGDIK